MSRRHDTTITETKKNEKKKLNTQYSKWAKLVLTEGSIQDVVLKRK